MEKFPQISIRLNDARAAAPLHPFFYAKNEALQKRTQEKNAKDL
jgi:hypothetical protein